MREQNFDPRRFLSKRAKRLPASGIRRFFDIARQRENVISLAIGEPDMVTPKAICEEAISSLQEGDTHYTSNRGAQSLREAISDYLERRFALSYCAESEILVTVGGSEALDLAFRAMLDIGDEVLILEPCYVSYVACVELTGATAKTVITSPDNNFKVDIKELRKAITPRTKILVISSPNNPTGVAYSPTELEEIAEIAREFDLLVISDELYVELNYEQEPHSFASIPGMQERTILVGGFSKAFAMTGWRLGYCCGPAELMETINRIHQYAIMCAPTMAQRGAIVAVEQAEKLVVPIREEFAKRREIVLAKLQEVGIPAVKPQGAFYVFADIRQTGLGAMEFCERLLAEKYVEVVPGDAFGASGAGHVRISYAASMAELSEGIRRMGELYQELI